MKKSTFTKLGMLIAGSWFASNVAWGGPPPEPPRQGGIPQCEEQLLESAIDLAICEATTQTFPATGQTSCWDSAGNLLDSCDGTGHDGDIQAGADLSYTDNGLTITDNNTKLEWVKQDDNDMGCGSYPGNLDMDCTFTWDDAFTFVASLNQVGHGGYTDWRMPNVRELMSIVNYQKSNPPTVSAAFDTGCVAGCTVDACSCTVAKDYYSSTSFAGYPRYAWIVLFVNGNVMNGGVKVIDRHVRAVRGGL